MVQYQSVTRTRRVNNPAINCCNQSQVKRVQTMTTVGQVGSCSGCNITSAAKRPNPNGPWLGIDYKAGIKSNHPVPSIANSGIINCNGDFSTKHNMTRQSPAVSCGIPCSTLGCSNDPGSCGTDSCGNSNGVGCSDQMLGKVFVCADENGSTSWSSIRSTALAGTPAANGYVLIRGSDDCGVTDCQGQDADGQIRVYNEKKGTWDIKNIEFATNFDRLAINGDGITVPFSLNTEFIIQNYDTILGN